MHLGSSPGHRPRRLHERRSDHLHLDERRGAHELAPADIARCTVYVDSRAGAPVSASELRPMVERDPGLVVADLAELVTAATPDRPAGPAFFRSVGLGIEDIAIAALLKGPRT